MTAHMDKKQQEELIKFLNNKDGPDFIKSDDLKKVGSLSCKKTDKEAEKDEKE